MAYVEEDLRFDSTIDAASTNLFVKTCRDTAFQGPMPLAVLIPGYSQGAAVFTQATMRRYASYGLAVCAVGTRGKDGSTGARDSGGREGYDVLDAIDRARGSALGPFLSGVNTVVGYSGGGGNALGLISRAPATFSIVVAFFEISDYGLNNPDGWWFSTFIQVTSATTKAELTLQVGDRALPQVLELYRTRSEVEAILDGLSIGSSHLYIYHDSADVTVPVENSRRIATALASVPTRFNYSESQPADSVRWLHGYPSTSPNLIFAENGGGGWAGPIFVPSMLAASTSLLPSVRATPFQVNGWLRADTLAGRFEIWLGSTPFPRVGGGEDRIADLTWNVPAGTFTVTPLNGGTWVDLRLSGSRDLRFITAPTVITFGPAAPEPDLLLYQNLAQRSEDFEASYWGKFQMTLTFPAVPVAPPSAGTGGGTIPVEVNAFVEDGNAGQHAAFLLVPPQTIGQIYTVSVYAHEGTRRWLDIIVSGAVRGYFDLQTGTLGSVVQGVPGSFISRAIEAIGGGWFRCSVTYTAVATVQINFEPESADGGVGYVGVAGAEAIYLTGAVLGERSIPGPYQPTTNTPFDALPAVADVDERVGGSPAQNQYMRRELRRRMISRGRL